MKSWLLVHEQYRSISWVEKEIQKTWKEILTIRETKDQCWEVIDVMRRGKHASNTLDAGAIMSKGYLKYFIGILFFISNIYWWMNIAPDYEFWNTSLSHNAVINLYYLGEIWCILKYHKLDSSMLIVHLYLLTSYQNKACCPLGIDLLKGIRITFVQCTIRIWSIGNKYF